MDDKERIEKHAERVMMMARASIERAVTRHVHEELRRIHAQSFYRHRIYFLDAMGSIGITVGKGVRSFCVGLCDDRYNAVFAELDELHRWYANIATEHDITADELELGS